MADGETKARESRGSTEDSKSPENPETSLGEGTWSLLLDVRKGLEGDFQWEGSRGPAEGRDGGRDRVVHRDAQNLLGLVPNLMQSRAKALLKLHVTGTLGREWSIFTPSTEPPADGGGARRCGLR